MITTYQKANGAIFTLAHHSLQKWADLQAQRMLLLGCSPAFVSDAHRAIAQARPLDQGVGHVR